MTEPNVRAIRVSPGDLCRAAGVDGDTVTEIDEARMAVARTNAACAAAWSRYDGASVAPPCARCAYPASHLIHRHRESCAVGHPPVAECHPFTLAAPSDGAPC